MITIRVPSLLLACSVFFVMATDALAVREARPQQLDRRVRTIMFQPDAVYKFVGHYRYQSAIEFEEDEQIKTISMGDSTAWMLNPSGNRLFLKPIEQDATTNMTLITNKRTYLFELHARETDDINDQDMTFVMRFIYSDVADNISELAALQNVNPEIQAVAELMDKSKTDLTPSDKTELAKYNYNYTLSGTDEIAPIRVFDDGDFTYFQFRKKNTELPAFFIVDDQGNEGIVNFRSRGDYVVIERVASRFTLRSGTNIVCVFNETAKPRKVPPSKFLGIF